MTSLTAPLRALAGSYGVQTRYIDVTGARRKADPECVLAVLRSLGAEVAGLDDVERALRERRSSRCRRVVPPVVPLWDESAGGIRMALPADLASRDVEAALHLEDGEVREWSPSARTVLRTVEVKGARYIVSRFPLPSLPHGYHRLRLRVAGVDHESLLVQAPVRAYRDRSKARRWGLFAPLHALHSRTSDGIGNFSDLARLMDWTHANGGDFVATLPFLAAFPDEPSPYSPMSRLFWDELYVDTGGPGEAPERILDYEAVHASHRKALEKIQPGGDAVELYCRAHPFARDFARFRAASTRHRVFWDRWPEPHRSGVIEDGEIDEAEVRCHLGNQVLAENQLADLWRHHAALYLDLPLGVHRFGYDTWRERSLFAHDADVGAPPDAAFPGGQNWSTPPVDPERSRSQGHDYLRRVFRRSMQFSSILRIDHVMGLHRQFWIPKGADVSDGVYVRYPAEELYAILSLESHRARCELVGENLGLVPDVVNRSMARHGLRGLYIQQLTPEAPIPIASVASLNTHDTATFAAHAGVESAEEKLREALARLMASPAELVSVTLEDLWLETEPHNVPGTSRERPNWRRTMRHALEELDAVAGPLVDGFER